MRDDIAELLALLRGQSVPSVIDQQEPATTPIRIVPPMPPVPPRKPEAGRARMAMLLLTAIGASIALPAAMTAIGCSWRQRTTAGIGAFIDCESPDIAPALPDLVPLAKEALMGAVSGDGHVDTARLRADMQPAKSDLVRCAIAGAVSALATPQPKQPGAPAAAELEMDGPELLSAFVGARAELGWAPVRIAGGKVL